MLRTAALLAAAGAAAGLSEDYVRANSPLLWAQFKETHGKSYSPVEEQLRFRIFTANMLQAVRLERENPRATFGASKFADLTAEEFKVYHSLSVPERPSPPPMFDAAAEKEALASSVDWRKKGAVTQVKDQAQCGSCWAFSSTGGIEGQWFLAGNKLTSVSEQELVSCDKVDSGCNGGLMDNAYSWLVSKRGGQIVTEAAYPYTSGTGRTGTCKSLTGKAVGATISGHKDITHTEAQMAAYVLKHGPLPIAVDAASHWQTYTGGIVSSCTGKQLDHGVLAVGYTSEYWIVKNSWGSSWGESGYIRLAFGSNQCGLNKSPTAAIAKGAAAAPAPAPPAVGSFTQKQCSDSACSSGCNSATFAIGQCLQVSGGGSAVVESCGADGMVMKVYLTSSNCQGLLPMTSTQPTNQCLQSTAGTYIENTCGSAPVASSGATLHTTDLEAAAFGEFKLRFGKQYAQAEEPRRLAAFRASLARVRASGNPTHGITKFADLTPQEFQATYLRRQPAPEGRVAATWDGTCTACKRFPELANFTGTSFDWTTKGAVTAVKDQGQCGSCWSFGTTGDIEGTWFLAGNKLVSLSEQELVSCEKQDAGCNGGLQENAFAWIIKQGGIVADATYPYKSGGGRTGTCDAKKESPVAAKISKWFQVSKTKGGEADMLKQLPQVGPITIGINAGPMQDYSGGVDDPWLCRSGAAALDHAVLVVGFGTDNGVDYWKIKNSWNTDWGEEGYYRIVRGKNKCGLAMDAVHSVV